MCAGEYRMLIAINLFLQTLTITIGTFMVERYVLLEPAMEPKRQRLFYIISFTAVIIAFFLIGDAAQYVALLFGGLNIFLGRSKHRFIGFFMVIPLIGIMDGAAAPIIFVNTLLGTGYEDSGTQAGILIVYLVIMALLAVFYFRGKKWREWFGENMKNRRLRVSEYALIWVSGVVMMICSNIGSHVSLTEADLMSESVEETVGLLFGVYEIMAFMLTITIVVLIMQGNRRTFYHAKVSGMQFSIIATMADIVENRDENTGGHIKRTAKYVEIIAKKLQEQNAFPDTLTEQYLADMIVAAPLHDIGKIHIPDAILNKPGKLTDEEYEIIKTHAAAGRDVLLKAKSQLGEFDYLNTAIEMAEYHHEWWNGKGYPNAIAGDEIPLCARIMAVADVFDALTARRCYKDAMPLETAYRIIREETGTHFDPVVADAFFASREEIEAAMQESDLF